MEEAQEVMAAPSNVKNRLQHFEDNIVKSETLNYLKYLKGREVANRYGLATDQRFDWDLTRGLWRPRAERPTTPGHSPESYL